MRIQFCFLSMFLLLAANAHAAEITRENRSTIYLSGAISEGDAEKFKHLYTEDTTLLRVKSQGGSAEEGMLLGKFIYDKKMDIEIDKGCASSCALYLFTAANRKTIPKGSILGLHGTAYLTALGGENDLRDQLLAGGLSKADVDAQLPHLYQEVQRIGSLETDFARYLHINEQFYRDFKIVIENSGKVEEIFRGRNFSPLWWPASARLLNCYGIRNVDDLARPEELTTVGYAFDEKHAFLLLGDQALPPCAH